MHVWVHVCLPYLPGGGPWRSLTRAIKVYKREARLSVKLTGCPRPTLHWGEPHRTPENPWPRFDREPGYDGVGRPRRRLAGVIVRSWSWKGTIRLKDWCVQSLDWLRNVEMGVMNKSYWLPAQLQFIKRWRAAPLSSPGDDPQSWQLWAAPKLM